MFELLRGHVQCKTRGRYVLIAPCCQLRAGGVQHPSPNVDNQPAFLGSRNELGRLPHSIARRLPTQQSFYACERSIRHHELRLIEERKLAPPKRAIQSGVGRLDRFARHVQVEECHAAAAEVLCAVHRCVRIAHQIVDHRAIVGEQGDADAGAHIVIAPPDIYRQLQ